MTDKLELEDIQGILGRGYGKLEHACFICYKLDNLKDTSKTFTPILEHIEDATGGAPEKCAINIALTHPGLGKFELSASCLNEFPRVLRNGMSAKNKSRILGDTDESEPEKWLWGSDDKLPDLLLMIYAVDQSTLHQMLGKIEVLPGKCEKAMRKIAKVVTTLSENGSELSRSESTPLPDKKEHFGFRDGISQPKLAGIKNKERGGNAVAAGEFILGYKDEYDLVPSTPRVYMLDDPLGYLPTHSHDPNYRDLGRNGSYMVFRQLKQDVYKFWDYIKAQATGEEDQVMWASKMVGRWPNGCPFSKSTGQPQDLKKMDDDNDFVFEKNNRIMKWLFGSRARVLDNDNRIMKWFFGSRARVLDNDNLGMECPVGSHVRRMNPRHSKFPNTNHPVTEHTTHRILRRGRTYGKPVVESMSVEDLLKIKDTGDQEERGLNFICFNTNIERQFEFIQQSWAMNPKFAGLRNDPDPIIGKPVEKVDKNGVKSYEADFTMQALPMRRKIKKIPRFVSVRAGAYFFLPGIRALNYLMSDKHQNPQAPHPIKKT